MGFCIMHIAKQKRGGVFGLQIEANRREGDGRSFDLSDIDEERTGENVHLRFCENWNREITRQLDEAGVTKVRKDAVVMLTGVYTASPEWFESHSRDEWMAYFKDCLAYHDATYGRAFNAVIHLDEATPHMQVASVPLITDETGTHLSAKLVMGGREDYRLRQDRFYEDVGRAHGLERGERRDPAEVKRHTTKREWQVATLNAEYAKYTEQVETLAAKIAEWRRRGEDPRTFSSMMYPERASLAQFADELPISPATPHGRSEALRRALDDNHQYYPPEMPDAPSRGLQRLTPQALRQALASRAKASASERRSRPSEELDR